MVACTTAWSWNISDQPKRVVFSATTNIKFKKNALTNWQDLWNSWRLLQELFPDHWRRYSCKNASSKVINWWIKWKKFDAFASKGKMLSVVMRTAAQSWGFFYLTLTTDLYSLSVRCQKKIAFQFTGCCQSPPEEVALFLWPPCASQNRLCRGSIIKMARKKLKNLKSGF